MVGDLSKQDPMVLNCQWPLAYASNILVVGLTRSNHSCIFTTYILSLRQELSVVYSCSVGDLSKRDLMVLVGDH